MKKNFTLQNYLLLFTIIFSFTAQAQKTYGGIEIGVKAVKMSIITIEDAEDDEYEVKDYWVENFEKTAVISKDANLTPKGIDSISAMVQKNFEKMILKYKIDRKNFYIIADSGIGGATNSDLLAQKVKQLTNTNLTFISDTEEAKLLLRGCIPRKKYSSSMILDMGSANTIGGYMGTIKGEDVFHPLTLDLGSITLTEIINQKSTDKSIDKFNELSFNYHSTLKESFSSMFKKDPESINKPNIFLTGGATWAFYSLFYGTISEKNFSELKHEDILNQKSVVENNFRKIENAALTNPIMQKVLKVYSQKNLISSFNILLTALEEIPDLQNKKIYFAKNGQIAWFVSYVIDQELKQKALLKK
jgi:exopolyphosphatase/pppGpp-phosphohydrolase